MMDYIACPSISMSNLIPLKLEKRPDPLQGSLSNVVVEWLAVLLRVQDVSGSNLGLETSYPD
jgi:hypothetical protein